MKLKLDITNSKKKRIPSFVEEGAAVDRGTVEGILQLSPVIRYCWMNETLVPFDRLLMSKYM